ncbi:hypothetical protein Tco_0863541 [Tanacetum coccineum]
MPRLRSNRFQKIHPDERVQLESLFSMQELKQAIVNVALKSKLKLLLFKVDFEKAFDSVSWDFFINVMKQMGFGHRWCEWIKAEALQVSIRDACDNDIYNGLSLANDGSNISLLQYADDALFLANGLLKMLRTWLSSWKSCLLSIGGRLTLSKEVLGSLPLYYLSIFKAPTMILKQLESIRRHFFGGFKDEANGISWVKWDSVLQSSESGGLGIGSLRAKNLGLLEKWWWRFLNEKNAVWCKVISMFYGVDGGFSSRIGSGLHKSNWENVISSGEVIGSHRTSTQDF